MNPYQMTDTTNVVQWNPFINNVPYMQYSMQGFPQPIYTGINNLQQLQHRLPVMQQRQTQLQHQLQVMQQQPQPLQRQLPVMQPQ